jgi:hypothetical protein
MFESKRALGLDVSTGLFPLGSLRTKLLSIREALENDLGIYMLHGLPVERYSDEQLRIIFLGLGRHLGTTLPQSTEGEHLQDVIDRGEPLFGDNGRGTNSRDSLPWHTDRCDVVSLLCIRKALTGGESKVASMANMYNILRRERPDLLELLCQPFHHGRAQWEAASSSPTYELPVFTFCEQQLASRYLRHFIHLGQDFQEVPRLSARQKEALDYMDARFEHEDVCMNIGFEPGDIQLLNNLICAHSRATYTSAAPNAGRFLLRLWLAVPNSRPLVDAFLPLYGDVRPGAVRGGILKNREEGR